MANIILSATQMACSWDINDNIARAEALVRVAAADGSQIILLQDNLRRHIFALIKIQNNFR